MTASLDDLTRHTDAPEAAQLTGVDGGIFWVHLGSIWIHPDFSVTHLFSWPVSIPGPHPLKGHLP